MEDSDRRDIRTLLGIMARLRDPATGCPWDVEQDFASIAPYTIEEAYEVADAIDRDDLGDLRDELGDLLFQVVFHAQMASELRAFDFGDVVAGINDKMISRHPHVFAGQAAGSAEDRREGWETRKAAERFARGADRSVLAGVGMALPALARAEKLGRRAARVGLDWPDADGVTDKIREEIAEIGAARATGDRAELQEEIGDLLLASASLARHCRVDPEEALRQACRKFEGRVRRIEDLLAERGLDWRDLSATDLDRLWEEAKQPR